MHLTTTLLSTLSLTLLPLTTALPPPPSPIPNPHQTPNPSTRLWATHYNGHIYTLDFTGTSLNLTNAQKTCGRMPSWLTFDAEARTLYCSDESGNANPDTHGTLTAYRAGEDGELKELAETETVGGGVNSVVFEDAAGGKFLAIAHYEGSALSTYKLPLHPQQPAEQVFHFTMTHQGSTAQQNAPHPHEVILDPTGSFIVSPDLGADLLHVYSIDAPTGHLHACPSVNVTFGSGPRHAVFWSDGTDNVTQVPSSGGVTHQRQAAAVGKTMLYLLNEIGGTLMAFDVSYARSGCLDFQKVQTVVPYTGGVMPEGATPAEIRMVGETIYASIRSDHGFGANDSMITLDRSPSSGRVRLRERTSAFGSVPRTFVLNRAGDLVAIGDQSSSTVAIVRRDRETGDLGEEVAVLQVGEPGEPGTAQGLSSVVWEE